MRAIILAAGRGTRISRYLEGNPKCTVDIGGQRLIRYTVELLKRHGVGQIALAVGYQHGVVEHVLQGEGCSFFYNPFYDVTNSIASIWFSQAFIDGADDYLIMNGDVFVEDALLEQVVAAKENPVLFADSSRIREADYRFAWKDGLLTKYGKELSDAETDGEYIGIGVIRAPFVTRFKQRMLDMVARQQHGVWWENVLYSFVGEEPVHVEDVHGRFWAEVDYIEDYERILRHRGKTLAEVEGVRL